MLKLAFVSFCCLIVEADEHDKHVIFVEPQRCVLWWCTALSIVAAHFPWVWYGLGELTLHAPSMSSAHLEPQVGLRLLRRHLWLKRNTDSPAEQEFGVKEGCLCGRACAWQDLLRSRLCYSSSSKSCLWLRRRYGASNKIFNQLKSTTVLHKQTPS